MLKKFEHRLFVLKFTIVVFLTIPSKTYANYLPIKVNCDEKKCCARIDSIEFKIDELLNEINKGKMSQEEIACSYHQIANEYYNIDQIKSIEFNKKAEAIRLKNKDSLLWITYLNLAFNYYNIYDNNAAKTYMELALFTEIEKQPYDYLTIYQSLGEYYSRLGDYETAELYINQALATKVEEKEKITAYNIKSRILFESKDSLKIRESNFFTTSLLFNEINTNMKSLIELLKKH